jgi:hypothetical protein
LAVLLALAAACCPAQARDASRVIRVEAEDAVESRLLDRRSRVSRSLDHSGKGYWALFAGNEQLTCKFSASPGKYFIWVRSGRDRRQPSSHGRLNLYVNNQLIGAVDQASPPYRGPWNWQRLGPVTLKGGYNTLRLKKLLTSRAPTLLDVILLTRNPKYSPTKPKQKVN